MKFPLIKEIFERGEVGKEYIVGGWVRNRRDTKPILFVSLSDGSFHKSLQLCLDKSYFSEEVLDKIWSGASLVVKGLLSSSPGREQSIELQVRDILHLGEVSKDEYPLQPKWHSFEYLRENAHLRFRTTLFSGLMRIRSFISYEIHRFFQERGFIYLHTPIITPSDCEGAGNLFTVTTLEDNFMDYSKDFFGKRTYLTVSGQLEAEAGACALSRVYTFGPTFRAEPSYTTRHLSEFWMIEPEVAFYDLSDIMDLAEEFIKYLVSVTLREKNEELKAIYEILERWEKFNSKEQFALLERVANEEFVRISYTEAIEILQKSEPYKKKKFKYLIEWGDDIQTEHEKFLVNEHFRKGVIIYNYPKEVKAFYMKRNEDGKTVKAMDVLLPPIGEVIGGSQREENYELLREAIKERGMKEGNLWWYLHLRKYGSVVHSGFGLGLERFLVFLTGVDNVKDVIPFPRYPGYCEF